MFRQNVVSNATRAEVEQPLSVLVFFPLRFLFFIFIELSSLMFLQDRFLVSVNKHWSDVGKRKAL